MSFTPQEPAPGLEDRVRGLILRNRESAHQDVQQIATKQQMSSGKIATDRVPQPTLSYGKGSLERNSPNIVNGHRKRPNQAQRRKTNSQLSTPENQRYAHGYTADRPDDRDRNMPGHLQTGQDQVSNSYRHQAHQYHSNRLLHPTESLRSTHLMVSSPQLPYNHSSNRIVPQGLQVRNNLDQKSSQINRTLLEKTSPNTTIYGSNKYENLYEVCDLNKLIEETVSKICIKPNGISERENFRQLLENHCQNAIAQHEESLGNENFDASKVELRCFGSLMSGFATETSDMDLALITPALSKLETSGIIIPRLLEKILLNSGYGARLLSKTRIPIIKLCENPTKELLAALLEERAKWERNVEQPELVDKQNSTTSHDSKDDCRTTSDGPDIAQSLDKNLHSNRLLSLKQRPDQTLDEYYTAAKQVLKELGSHDVIARDSHLSPEQSKVLNDVCKAFIIGLNLNSLSVRIQKYRSILPLYNESLPFLQQSLETIYTRLKGESLAVAWETRTLKEALPKDELEAQALVQKWCSLIDSDAYLTNTFNYNRQLRYVYSKLKIFPSIRLAILKQHKLEEPTSYLERALKIMKDLQYGGNSMTVTDTLQVISHYISGIYNHEVQVHMLNQDFNGATLLDVGRQHRILQLAFDYEFGLALGVYVNNGQDSVQKFVTLLKSLNFRHSSSTCDSHIHTLISQLRILPDPTKLSNKKLRERFSDNLEFPKNKVGIQCDINFSAELAIHNTHLLRCYASCDPRVKKLVLFIKHWAKVRGINVPYKGTLSSYGYALMVLHYLVNVTMPFVCPNLQAIHSDLPDYSLPSYLISVDFIDGRDVRFWRNETQIKKLALQNQLNNNKQSAAELVRGFFEYYAYGGMNSGGQGRGFDWAKDVISLRTMGGLLKKQQKDWRNATTIIESRTTAAIAENIDKSNTGEDNAFKSFPSIQIKPLEGTREVRNRYLLAIEDPFELDHNVARTVTHQGVQLIRDEFRRAWGILRKGRGSGRNQDRLLEQVTNITDDRKVLNEIFAFIDKTVG
ncbi:poly(A) polymerase Cid1-like protein [Blumeria hordei DH14]|uniref:polynucleotide adenylyltransferase n=1 Tax=Blumeria graminis f. sp. hordei (strain DH14) TaxID=546991 RepID=N1JJA0_BLUG1|nr:poly(A) polymerase Cid1-like protein [Blumeria hordei DH14]